jgi:hypothetical protein
MKLDAGAPKTLARLNRPTPEVTLESMIEGLKDVPGLIIQAVSPVTTYDHYLTSLGSSQNRLPLVGSQIYHT